jgi:hypothetical protein
VYTNAFKILDSGQKVVTASGDLVAKAYDNAQGHGDQKTFLLIMAAAVVAMVAFNKVHA